MKNKNTKLILGISIIIALITIGVVVFCVKIIKKTNQNSSALSLNLKEKIKEKKDATFFIERVNEIEVILNQMNSHFINPNKIDIFVSYLEEIGPLLGTEIVVKNVEVPTKSKNTISFVLLVTGSFNDVAKTIAMLENIPYQVTLNRVFLSEKIESEENLKEDIKIWQADISFDILSLE